MELEQFVSETLQQIISGVEKAQSFAAEHDAAVNPAGTGRSYLSSQGLVTEKAKDIWTTIDFDVAISVSDTSSKRVGGGLMVAAVGIGADNRQGLESSVVSRVRFPVSVRLPVQPSQ